MKLSDEDLKSGVTLCFSNANSLIDDAETLFRRRSYGHASFLALSAIEEIGKAYLYALHRAEIEKPEELKTDVIRHDTKFVVFLFSLLTDIIQKQIETGHAQITKPFDVDDFADIGKDWISAMGDLWNARNRSLYVDRVKRKWLSPLDTKRADAKSAIDAAKNMMAKFEPLCKNLLNPPIEVLRNAQKFLDSQLLPAAIEELYKNKIITKKLYNILRASPDWKP